MVKVDICKESPVSGTSSKELEKYSKPEMNMYDSDLECQRHPALWLLDYRKRRLLCRSWGAGVSE